MSRINIKDAIRAYLEEHLEVRVETDRFGDYDGRGVEVTTRLVLVDWDGDRFGSSHIETEISMSSSKIYLELGR